MNDFIFIIDSVKDNTESWLYHISDNATIGSLIGTLIAIILGSFIAGWQYRKQKDIDRLHMRQDEVINELLLFKSKIENADFKFKNLVIRGNIVGPKKFVEENEGEMIKAVEDAVKDLHDFDFYIKNKIKTLLELYFYNKENEIFKQIENEKNNLLIVFGDRSKFSEFIGGSKNMNFDNLNMYIKNLTNAIHEVKKLKVKK